MLDPLEKRLAASFGAPVKMIDTDNDEDSEDGSAEIMLLLGSETRLRACYWRVIAGNTVLSSFDHGQIYGLPAPIDAREELRALLEGRTLASAMVDRTCGDLLLTLSDGTRVQVFGFTGYEAWELSFADGTTETSNYACR